MNKRIIRVLLIISPIIFIVSSLFIGRYPITVHDVISVLWSKLTFTPSSLPDEIVSIVWDIRMPRALLGALVGGALAISGASFQGLFRNPLVSAGILGVSQGAGFGAALAILLFGTSSYIYIFAFIFGGSAVLLSYLIGRVYKTTPTIMLVLGGTIISSIFTALISFAKYVADPADQLQSIVFWLMGSLASVRYEDILIAVIPIGIGVSGLIAMRWRINVLSMGDKEAHSLGIDPALNKGIIVICTTLATAGAVCVSGIIGWVGLIIPHIARMIVGNDNRILIPASLALGACFLIFVDNLGRIITGAEMPIGILTALVGGPFFVYLLKSTKGGGW